MNKIFASITIIGVILISILFKVSDTPAEANTNDRFSKRDSHLTITIDKKTKCKYIIYKDYTGHGGITPLLKPDGTPDCK